jgi:hypothetical protein
MLMGGETGGKTGFGTLRGLAEMDPGGSFGDPGFPGTWDLFTGTRKTFQKINPENILKKI